MGEGSSTQHQHPQNTPDLAPNKHPAPGKPQLHSTQHPPDVARHIQQQLVLEQVIQDVLGGAHVSIGVQVSVLGLHRAEIGEPDCCCSPKAVHCTHASIMHRLMSSDVCGHHVFHRCVYFDLPTHPTNPTPLPALSCPHTPAAARPQPPSGWLTGPACASTRRRQRRPAGAAPGTRRSQLQARTGEDGG